MLRIVVLLLNALVLGLLLAHTAEWPGKATLDGPTWLTVQLALYRNWGPVFGPLEAALPVLNAVLLWQMRRDFVAVRLLSLVELCWIAALAVFFLRVQPVNHAFAGWTPTTLPPDWAAWRDRWESGHAVRFVLALLAFVALSFDTVRPRRAAERVSDRG